MCPRAGAWPSTARAAALGKLPGDERDSQLDGHEELHPIDRRSRAEAGVQRAWEAINRRHRSRRDRIGAPPAGRRDGGLSRVCRALSRSTGRRSSRMGAARIGHRDIREPPEPRRRRSRARRDERDRAPIELPADQRIAMPTYLVSRNSSMPTAPPSRPRPDCLTPPNGRGRVGDDALVEPDHAGLQGLGDAQRAAQVVGEDVGDQAVLGVVGRRDRPRPRSRTGSAGRPGRRSPPRPSRRRAARRSAPSAGRSSRRRRAPIRRSARWRRDRRRRRPGSAPFAAPPRRSAGRP